MKRLCTSIISGTLVLAVAAMLLSCGDTTKTTDPVTPSDPDPKPDPKPQVVRDTVVYAVGQEAVSGKDHYYAAVWRNGKRLLLTDGSTDGFCNAVCADDEYVYVVGCEAIGKTVDDGYYEPYALNVGVLWKMKADDGTLVGRTLLSDGERNTSPVAVSVANGNVCVAGFETLEFDRKAVVWKNDKMEYLTDGTTDALAYCVLASGDDVYVGGYQQTADKQGGIARIWKNSVAQDLTDGSTVAKVCALCLDKGILYAAGTEKTVGGRWKGVLWIDGRATYFTEEVGTEVTGLFVQDGNYVIEGNMTDADGNIVTCIWTAEGVRILSEGLEMCQGTGLAVAGKDIYVAGNEVGMDDSYEMINHAHLWKNGTAQSLEIAQPDDVSLWGVACAFVVRE